MALTAKQIYDLNNANVAAQNVSLGSFLMGAGGEAGVYVVTPEDITSGSVLIEFTGGSVIDTAYAVVGRGYEDVVGVTATSSGSILTVSGSVLEAGDIVNYYMS